MSSDEDLSAPHAGFPLRRNGTCLDSETSCGPTWGGFYACCPGESICPGTRNSYYNNVCCPSWANCTLPLMEEPHCAEPKASLFEHTGYFCCLPGQTGFWTTTDAVGCSVGYPDDDEDTILVAIQTNSTSTTTASSTSATLSSTNTSSATSASSASPGADHSASSGGTNTGAIAGGVVGGVAGLTLILALCWFLIRRQRKQKEISTPNTPLSEPPPVYGGVNTKHGLRELDAAQAPSELVGNHPVHEMPDTSTTSYTAKP